MGSILALANQKGGGAKTTSVHALAAALVEQGRRPLVIDLDPQASLTWACGLDPDTVEVSLHDVLLGRAKAPDVIVQSNGIHLLPSTIDLAGAELHLLTKTGREYVLRRVIQPMRDGYDLVF